MGILYRYHNKILIILVLLSGCSHTYYNPVEFVDTTPPKFLFTWGKFGTEPGEFNYPTGICIDSSGYVYICDADNYRIQKFDSLGNFVSIFYAESTEFGERIHPYAIAYAPDGNLYVTDDFGRHVVVFDTNGNYIRFGGAGATYPYEFDCPCGIAVDKNNMLFICDGWNEPQDTHYVSRVVKMEPIYFRVINEWGNYGQALGEFREPRGIAIDYGGYIYVADKGNHRIQKFTDTGEFVASFGDEGTEPLEFVCPRGVAVFGEFLYVTDTDNNRVQKLLRTGQFVTEWGKPGKDTCEFDSPIGIALSPSGKKIYIVDKNNHRIQVFGY